MENLLGPPSLTVGYCAQQFLVCLHILPSFFALTPVSLSVGKCPSRFSYFFTINCQ